MKKAQKLISVSVLSSLREVEDGLAKREGKGMLDALPDGHPLKQEAMKMSSDELSSLPEGHPLRISIEAAKKRYSEAAVKQEVSPGIKKAKKIEAQRVEKQRRADQRREDDLTEKRFEAGGKVNSFIDKILDDLRSMWPVLSENEEILNTHPLGRARILRLKRLGLAMERGISECRMARR